MGTRMIFERGTREDTLATFPTRQFAFVLDPADLRVVQEESYAPILRLMADLRNADPPVQVVILWPAYLVGATTEKQINGLDDIVISLNERPDIPSFTPEASMAPSLRSKLLEDAEESRRALSLLALADATQADGVVTGSAILIEARYVLRRFLRIRIVHLEEFADLVEVCAHGHSVFWSVTDDDRRLGFDSIYVRTHWKARRLFDWFSSVQQHVAGDELRENLRSALLNRYPFLLYSRDMVRFYELQMDYYARRGLLQRFGLANSYHLTAFYLLLWGMLDQLTMVAKYSRNLTVAEEDCGIRRSALWRELEPKEPGLAKFVSSDRVNQWITVMAEMRHVAAHRTVTVPSPMLAHTEESRRSDAEIREIVRKERALLYSLLPPAMMHALEPMLIWRWRVSYMKSVAPSMVLVKGKAGEYFRDPVVSIDHDLGMLTAVMDAFLAACWSLAKGG